MTNQTTFAGEILDQVLRGKKGSGGVSEGTIIYRGMKYTAIEIGIFLRLPNGERINIDYTQGGKATGLSILFRRYEDREDHVAFAVLDEDDEVVTTSKDGATGYIYAAFVREGSKRPFCLAMIATAKGEERYSELMISDEQRTIAFLCGVGGMLA